MTAVDVVVIGGGAAGLMCAIEAGRRGRRVWVVEHANKLGKKILMSGGGRCNFTNLDIQPENYLSANPRFCRSALARFSQWDFIARVQAHGIAYHEKELGQLFCDESSKLILRMLLDDCAAAGVRLSTDTSITAVTPVAGGFELMSSQGPLHCASLVVASGGLSIPKMGASGFGYQLARQFGHALLPTRAGLVPITLSGRPLAAIDGLAGLAIPARLEAGGQSFNSAMLLTHRGLSGPAVLQISSYWDLGQPLHLDLLPGQDAAAFLLQRKAAAPATEFTTLLTQLFPKRLAQRISDWKRWQGPLQQYADAALQRIGERLNAWPIPASGTEGYRTAEVTLGGVDTRELSSQTMESRRQPGLYFIGEVVDVTGHLGGYNFQWAWASGHAAGQVC